MYKQVGILMATLTGALALASASGFSSGQSCEQAGRLLPATSLATYIVYAEAIDLYYEGKDAQSVHTFAELRPIEMLKAPLGATPSTIVAMWRGGVIEDGSEELIGMEMPRFALGDTAIVFLSKQETSPYLEIMGARMGKYDVRDGRLSRGALKGLTASRAVSCLRGLVEERSPHELALASDVVCLGEVISKDIVVSDSTGERSTLTRLSVEKVLRGEISSGEVAVLQEGDYTDVGKWKWDLPMIEVGKKYILFLKDTEDNTYDIVGGFGGSYRIEDGVVWKKECSVARFESEITSH